MTLHEAILRILDEVYPAWLAAAEIKQELISRNLFPGNPDPAVSARINNYPHLFETDKSGVCNRYRSRRANPPQPDPRPSPVPPAPVHESSPLESEKAPPWDWEGSVQTALVRHLEARGWVIHSTSDTFTRQQGPDICADKDGLVTLVIEVKGYPSTSYARGPRQGQSKPTRPSNQAHKWFSRAILWTLRRRRKHPVERVAIGLPRHPVYEKLVDETAWALDLANVGIFFVERDGTVRDHRLWSL